MRSKVFSIQASFSLSLLGLLIAFGALNAASQESDPETGSKLGSSYSIGQFDTVNTTNGNLMFSFPLAKLPAGRGQAAAGIGLFYNSKLYRTRVTKYKDDRYACNWQEEGPETCTYYYKTTLEQDPKGG
jgi:hypothetical protein